MPVGSEKYLMDKQAVSQKLFIYVFGLFLFTLCLRLILLVYYNNNLGGIEPNVIYGIQRILQGQSLYQDPENGSYAIMQYSPLWYHFIAMLARFSNIGYLEVQSLYQLCRATALCFGLLSVAIGFFVLRFQGFNKRTALTFSLPLLLILTSHYYTRCDSLALFFFVSGFFAFLSFSDKEGFWNLLLAAILSGCCMMTKQSGLLLPGIITCCLIFKERKYLWAIFYGFLTLLSTLAIAALCIQGHWHEFYQNAFLGLKNGIGLFFLSDMLTSRYYLDFFPCYFSAGFIIWLAFHKITGKTYRIFAIAIGLSFLFAVVTGLKKGSSNNYFTEFLFFVLLATPFVLQDVAGEKVLFKVRKLRMSIQRFVLTAFLILITSKTIGLFSVMYIDKSLKNNKEEYMRDKALYGWFISSRQLKKGQTVYFTGRGFNDNLFIDFSLMPTKDVVSQVFLADSQAINFALFVEGMNKGLVNYIVTDVEHPEINDRRLEIPFIRFDSSKFRLIIDTLGFGIYEYKTPE
jgi:hypothetical protein